MRKSRIPYYFEIEPGAYVSVPNILNDIELSRKVLKKSRSKNLHKLIYERHPSLGIPLIRKLGSEIDKAEAAINSLKESVTGRATKTLH